MARERKSAEERKSEIVETALELMSEQGARDVTAQAIADRIGIAQPTVFRHFRTRDAIFRAALKFISGKIFKILETVGKGGGKADQRLRTLLFRQIFIVSKNKGLPRLLFSDRLHLEDPELKKTVREVMDRYINHVGRLIEDGQEDGSFRADLDPYVSAQFVAATVQGLLIRWSIKDFEFALEEEADDLWRFIHSALAGRTPATYSLLEEIER